MRCNTKSVSKTGTIEWEIECWSALPTNHVTNDDQSGYTQSQVMNAAGHKWTIVVAPGGQSDPTDSEEEVRDKKEHVATYLHYKGSSESVRTNFSMTIVKLLKDFFTARKLDAINAKQMIYLGSSQT